MTYAITSTLVSVAFGLIRPYVRRWRQLAEASLLAAVLALTLELTFPHQAVAGSITLPPTDSAVAVEAPGDLPQLPLSEDRQYRVTRSVRASITAYTSSRDETDSDPFTTASGEKTRDGIVAMNGVPFGTKIRIPDYFGEKVFVVADRMHARYGTRYLDIWMTSKAGAKQWGVRRTTVEFVK